jgi:SAM-dependent methyltransferase
MDWRSDAAKNAALWAKSNADYTDEHAADNWALDEICWGIWGIDESELNVLGDVGGLEVVELGCGTAYFSAWLAKLGARPVGVDITPAQLATARRMMAETGIEFPLVEADAAVTGLPDASADLIVSEYGASIWVDPYRWIPEAARLLRTGGRLAFLRNSTLVILCSDDDVPAASSSTCPTASGSACCARTASRSSG